MEPKQWLVLLIVGMVLLDTTVCIPLKMHRLEDKLHSRYDEVSGFVNKYRHVDGSPTGSTIPLNGGLLTKGAYFMPITIGTPPQTFNVIVDTGSANTAVPYYNCTTCGSGSSSTKYNPDKSSSYAPVGCGSATCNICSPPGLLPNTSQCVFMQPQCANSQCAFGITYGGGSSGISGSIDLETVCLGQYCVDDLTFNLIRNEYPSGSFSGNGIDGIVGLCYPFNACNPTCTLPLFDAIVQQYQLPFLFGMCLTDKDGGLLDLGETNSSRLTTPFDYTPVITEHWYNIAPSDILVGGISINAPQFFMITTNDIIGAFVDSGTSVFLVGPLIYDRLRSTFETNFSKLPGVTGKNNIWEGNCVTQQEMGSQLKNFPNINITLPTYGSATQTFDVTIPPASYLLLVNNQYCLGIQSALSIGMVLGDVFMTNYYIVFDRENKRLGFSPLNPGSCS